MFNCFHSSAYRMSRLIFGERSSRPDDTLMVTCTNFYATDPAVNHDVDHSRGECPGSDVCKKFFFYLPRAVIIASTSLVATWIFFYLVNYLSIFPGNLTLYFVWLTLHQKKMKYLRVNDVHIDQVQHFKFEETSNWLALIGSCFIPAIFLSKMWKSNISLV